MPFKSQAQRAYMHIHHPKVAARWEKHTPKGKKLPKRIGESTTKIFKDLMEVLVTPLETADETGYQPRAKGERSFVDLHKILVTEPAPQSNGVHRTADNITKTKRATGGPWEPRHGERSPIEQGSSKLKDKSGFKGRQTKLNRGDKRVGDLKHVKTAPSSVATNESKITWKSIAERLVKKALTLQESPGSSKKRKK